MIALSFWSAITAMPLLISLTSLETIEWKAMTILLVRREFDLYQATALLGFLPPLLALHLESVHLPASMIIILDALFLILLLLPPGLHLMDPQPRYFLMLLLPLL